MAVMEVQVGDKVRVRLVNKTGTHSYTLIHDVKLNISLQDLASELSHRRYLELEGTVYCMQNLEVLTVTKL